MHHRCQRIDKRHVGDHRPEPFRRKIEDRPHSQASSAAADEGNTIRISRSSCDKGVQARQHVGEGEWFSQAGRHRVPPGAELTSTAYMGNREDHACVEQLEKQRIVVGALIHPVCTIDTEQAGSGTGAISPTDKSNGDPNAISSLAEKFLRLVDILVERSQLDPRLGFVQVDPATQGPVHIGADAHSENRTIPVGQGRDAQFRTSGATHRTDARQRNCRLGDDDPLVPPLRRPMTRLRRVTSTGASTERSSCSMRHLQSPSAPPRRSMKRTSRRPFG